MSKHKSAVIEFERVDSEYIVDSEVDTLAHLIASWIYSDVAKRQHSSKPTGQHQQSNATAIAED